MPTECFLIEPTDTANLRYRRFTYDRDCPTNPGGGHHAEVRGQDAPIVLTERGYIDTIPADPFDPEWRQVTTCACGYAFVDTDPYQVIQDRYYVDIVGSRFSIRSTGPFAAPPGAMWRLPWYEDTDWVGPEGHSYMLRLPDKTDWAMDGPARDGGRWTRTGVAPKLTAMPSIKSPGYHGWLTDGVLSDDIEGKTYAT